MNAVAICAKCARPIELTYSWTDSATGDALIKAYCHGEKETNRMPASERPLPGSKILLFFVPKEPQSTDWFQVVADESRREALVRAKAMALSRGPGRSRHRAAPAQRRHPESLEVPRGRKHCDAHHPAQEGGRRGDAMSNADRFLCMQCGKPVEFVNRRWHENTKVAEYTVQCHGKEDVLRLGEAAEHLLQAGLPLIAFVTTETPPETADTTR